MPERNIVHDARDEKWRLPLALLLIAIVTVAVYWQVLHNDFIDFDDDVYVTSNMIVRQGLTSQGFVWAFTAFHAGNWHPLTWLSHMLDVQLFHMDPRGHHAVSLLLHAVNALLTCAIFYRLTGFLGRSIVVALLFALHPLHVESVAWVAERKDVLSTLFWLLTIWTYAGYTRKPSLQRYLPVALLLALGLMAKQMLVTLPIVLLLLDYWPLQRISSFQDMKRLAAEKVPLLLISVAAALTTIRSQAAAGALSLGDDHSTLLYAGNALLSYTKYIGKLFWPTKLALFYPFEAAAVTPVMVAIAAISLAVTTGLVITQRQKRPYLLFGWGWYLITLLPVIGFIRVGSQALADRYTYIPLTGVFVALVWGGAELTDKWRRGPQFATAGTAVLLALLSAVTVGQIRYWQNSFTLYTRALAVVERNWLAHNNMAILLAQQYRYDEAIKHFRESLRINPNQPVGFINLGNAYQSVGNNGAALDAFREAVRLNPNDAEGHFRLGYAYLMSGSIDAAYQEHRQLQRMNDPRAQFLLDSIQISGKK